MDVMVFKTNVSRPVQVSRVSTLLTAMPAVNEWNFDLDDCDRILRVVARDIVPQEIEAALHGVGLKCEELPY